MKHLVFLISLLCTSLITCAQWNLTISSKVEQDGKGIGGAKIALLEGKKLVKEIYSQPDGDFTIDVPADGEYIIEVSYQDCNQKKFQVFTRGVPTEVAKDNFRPTYKIGGFTMKKPLYSIDYSALKNPMIKIVYFPEQGKFDHESEHTEGMLIALGKIRDAEKSLLDRHAAAVKEGDVFFKKNDCANAKISYEKAVAIIPQLPYEEYPKAQIIKCVNCIQEKEEGGKKAAEEAAQKIVAEKAEKERVEKEKIAAAEAAKVAKEKLEAQKKLDAELAQKAKEQAEKEKLAEAQAAKLAKEQAEKEKIGAAERSRAKAEEDKIASEKIAREKAAEEAALKSANEKAQKAKLEEAAIAKAAAAKIESEQREKAQIEKAEQNKLAEEKKAGEELRKKEEKERTAKEKSKPKEVAKRLSMDDKPREKAPKPVVAENEKPAPSGNGGLVNTGDTKTTSEKSNDAGSGKAKHSIPQVFGSDKYKVLIARADDYFKMKRYDEAKATYEEALTVRANDVYATSRLAAISKLQQK